MLGENKKITPENERLSFFSLFRWGSYKKSVPYCDVFIRMAILHYIMFRKCKQQDDTLRNII
jgi:hypothetical protein